MPARKRSKEHKRKELKRREREKAITHHCYIHDLIYREDPSYSYICPSCYLVNHSRG